MDRRTFLKTALSSGCMVVLDTLFMHLSRNATCHGFSKNSSSRNLNEARFYTSFPDMLIRCELCAQRCVIPPGKSGKCLSRINLDGRLYSLTFERPVAIHIDPVEKLPMRHILPGQSLLSIGTAGCNFSCHYCINSNISQKSPNEIDSMAMNAKELINIAKKRDIPGIAFTYNEPTVAYEFMYETFTLAKKAGLKTFFHSNGFMEIEPLLTLLKLTDGIVVDLKAFSDRTYLELTGGRLEHVKKFLKTVHSYGTFLEIVNLIVPGFNDNPLQINELIRFIKEHLSPEVPLHFSRFFPKYQLSSLSPTPSNTIIHSLKLARKMGLYYVYTNNIDLSPENTICPKCKTILVERLKGKIRKMDIKKGYCPKCGHEIPGVWEM